MAEKVSNLLVARGSIEQTREILRFFGEGGETNNLIVKYAIETINLMLSGNGIAMSNELHMVDHPQFYELLCKYGDHSYGLWYFFANSSDEKCSGVVWVTTIT